MKYSKEQLKNMEELFNRLILDNTYGHRDPTQTEASGALFSTIPFITRNDYDSDLFEEDLKKWVVREKDNHYYTTPECYSEILYKILFGEDVDLPLYIDHPLKPVLAWRLENTEIAVPAPRLSWLQKVRAFFTTILKHLRPVGRICLLGYPRESK